VKCLNSRRSLLAFLTQGLKYGSFVAEAAIFFKKQLRVALKVILRPSCFYKSSLDLSNFGENIVDSLEFKRIGLLMIEYGPDGLFLLV